MFARAEQSRRKVNEYTLTPTHALMFIVRKTQAEAIALLKTRSKQPIFFLKKVVLFLFYEEKILPAYLLALQTLQKYPNF